MIDKEALKGAIGAAYQKSPWDGKGISMPPPAAPVQVFDHVTAARQGLRDAQNRSREISNLINCGTCGYPLAPEERTSLIERDDVMVKPAPVQEPVCDKDPQGCWSVRCQLGKKCKNTPPAAPDLQAELDATNRQVEILSDALAESRREVAALAVPVHKPLHPEIKKMYEDYFDKCFRESSAEVPENFMDALMFDTAVRDVDAMIALARADERESCAKVCDRMAARCNDIRAAALESAAENIRARGDI